MKKCCKKYRGLKFCADCGEKIPDDDVAELAQYIRGQIRVIQKAIDREQEWLTKHASPEMKPNGEKRLNHNVARRELWARRLAVVEKHMEPGEQTT